MTVTTWRYSSNTNSSLLVNAEQVVNPLTERHRGTAEKPFVSDQLWFLLVLAPLQVRIYLICYNLILFDGLIPIKDLSKKSENILPGTNS